MLEEHLGVSLEERRWARWQETARVWAELTVLRYDPERALPPEQCAAYGRLQPKLDRAFAAWLQGRYAPLGGQRLPHPHHLYHVPHYLAYQRRLRGREQESADRLALLVLDGLSLADWTLIGPAWRARHPEWGLEERLLLAQVPSLTSVSRQALLSGLRPADFVDTLYSTQAEPRRWAAFWAGEGLSAKACPCLHLALDRAQAEVGSALPEIESGRTRALCLIDRKVDELAHDATLGGDDFYASLRLWLKGYGRRVEALIEALLERGYAVYLASDHGHVEARGVGRPSEGLAVDVRAQRARIYGGRRAAVHAQQGFQSTLWGDDGLLPDGTWVLVPQGRTAFATYNQTVVTHGGLLLDEMVVPFVAIKRS